MAVVRVLAVVAVSLYLIPGGAHVLEMSNKLALPLTDYMIVQGIYAGWDHTAYALLAALVFTIAHAIVVWRQPTARWLSLGAFLALIANLAVFFAYTYPISNKRAHPELDRRSRKPRDGPAPVGIFARLQCGRRSAGLGVDRIGRASEQLC
jgi:hypothetical protein